MGDVLAYEKTILEFRHSLPDISFLKIKWEIYSLEVNTFLQIPQTDHAMKLLRRSRYCIILESEWNWAEQNEYAGQLNNRDLSINLITPASYFAVVLYLYIHQNTIREHLLDTINILIMDTLEEPMNITSIIDTVISQISIYHPELDEVQLTDLILNRIRHFLYHGILEIANE